MNTNVSQGIFTSNRGERQEHVMDYQFDVREEPLVTKSGLEVVGQRAIIRGDTDKVVGTVGSNYKILSHADALDPILDELDRKGVKTFQRVALAGEGAKMFANIYFPGQEVDFTTPNSIGHDKAWPGITVVNSLDGSLKYSLEATIYRLACTNGMRIPTAISSLQTVHSKNKLYEDQIDEIIAQTSDHNRFQLLQKWANHVLTRDQMGAMAEVIVEDKDCLFPKRDLPLVNEEIKKEESYGVVSAWGLYNSFNSVLEHNLIREKGKVERAREIDKSLFKVFSNTF